MAQKLTAFAPLPPQQTRVPYWGPAQDIPLSLKFLSGLLGLSLIKDKINLKITKSEAGLSATGWAKGASNLVTAAKEVFELFQWAILHVGRQNGNLRRQSKH